MSKYEYEFPELPKNFPELPEGYVYLGNSGIPNILLNYIRHSEEVWVKNWHDCGSAYREKNHYAVKFGGEEWNKWAQAKFDLPEIPKNYVWIGTNPFDRLKVGNFLGGRIVYGPENGWSLGVVSGACRNMHYILKKSAQEYSKVEKQFLPSPPNNEPEINSEDIVTEDDLQLLRDYKKACRELQEVRDNNWKVIYVYDWQQEPYPITEEQIIIIDGKVCLQNEAGVCFLWSNLKISKEELKPSFEIEGDGNGPYKPEYHKDYWKFGCKKISHEAIEAIQNIDADLKEVMGRFSIGKGEFTWKQIEELHDYHQKQIG